MNSVAYHGEGWTDGSDFATDRLPAEGGPLEPPLEYELRDLEPSTDFDRPGSAIGKRKAVLFTVLNLATLGFIIAWLAFDWWAIAYLISH
jgi:hypothetical protein